MSNKERETFGRICEKLGVLWQPESVADTSLPWNGEAMNGMRTSTRRQDTCNLWHELAHWLTTLPELRKYSGFGMGEGPDRPPLPARDFGPRVIIDSVAIEVKASALGIWLHGNYGDLKDAIAHSEEHGWTADQHRCEWKNREQDELLSRGLKQMRDIGLELDELDWELFR
jgi:hypothetical protein